MATFYHWRPFGIWATFQKWRLTMLLEVMPDLATFRDAMQALSTDSSLNNKYLESFQHGKSHDKKALTTATAEVKAFGTYVTQPPP